MRLPLAGQLAATVTAAAVCALLLLRPVLGWQMERHSLANGPWRGSLSTGGAQSNPWERAAVALAGLYALRREEAIYLTAQIDSQGQALRGDCRYRVEGPPPPARWWSLTVYGADHYLVPNAAGRYAITAREAGEPPRIALRLLAGADQPGSLPIPAQGSFSLTLRLYNPAPGLAAELLRLPLPQIHREGCA